jgi:hypothetical protein
MGEWNCSSEGLLTHYNTTAKTFKTSVVFMAVGGQKFRQVRFMDPQYARSTSNADRSNLLGKLGRAPPSFLAFGSSLRQRQPPYLPITQLISTNNFLDTTRLAFSLRILFYFYFLFYFTEDCPLIMFLYTFNHQ